ncbi:MlaC/ttg2D family ABC transporter substrate-binding protein [Oceanicella actignis]|uniref:Phospholipid transport system substrate-binding protein n=1 Tax=Oceanicella actignis TaxID=1189325 RepID=A0A1M7RS22_9RHOB|nr:ABC transporter substrate-binding protein [Oceanicella actignis]SET06905.1 phospholipid transport system substrate-binding protein [Oceanicella actignis]SHN48888.1 phospholipid transport system substrate-binding protein [Oceanicella actignis]
MIKIGRRGFLALSGALLLARPAAALDVGAARGFVADVVGRIQALVDSGRPPAEQAAEFRRILAEVADVEAIARFVAGRPWREMSDAQRAAFREAFLDYVSRLYANIMADYKGERIEIVDARDFGKKGVLVVGRILRPAGDGSQVEFLVSDRGGDGLKVVDMVVEGVSMLQTQRQELAAMLEKRGGDVDRLIADLRG